VISANSFQRGRGGVAVGPFRVVRRSHRPSRSADSTELSVVWQRSNGLGLVSATPSSLIFLSDGIRIAERRLRLAISYDTFGAYTFRYEYIPGGRTGPDVAQLVIDGPTPWRSPSADQDAELIADDLTRINALAL
jgi:hypothetical protein